MMDFKHFYKWKCVSIIRESKLKIFILYFNIFRSSLLILRYLAKLKEILGSYIS